MSPLKLIDAKKGAKCYHKGKGGKNKGGKR